MTAQTASCRCRLLTVTTTGEPVRVSVCDCLSRQKRSGSAFADPTFPHPRFSVWEQRKPAWVEIVGEDVERRH